MSAMFDEASSFNSDLSNWNVLKVNRLADMSSEAISGMRFDSRTASWSSARPIWNTSGARRCSTGPGGETCQNGGTAWGPVGACGCRCPYGYIGETCADDDPKRCRTGPDGRACMNGAVYGTSTDGCRCACQPEYTGDLCDSLADAGSTPSSTTRRGRVQIRPQDAHNNIWTGRESPDLGSPISNSTKQADEGKSSDSGVSVASDVLIAVLLVLVVGAAIVAVIFFRRRHRKSSGNLKRNVTAEYTTGCRALAWNKFRSSFPHLIRPGETDPLEGTAAARRNDIALRGMQGTSPSGHRYFAQFKSRAKNSAIEPSCNSNFGSPLVLAKVSVGLDQGVMTEVSANELRDFLLEAHLLLALKQRTVLGVLGVVADSLPMVIVTELMGNGNLKTYLRACRPLSTRPMHRLGVPELVVIAT